VKVKVKVKACTTEIHVKIKDAHELLFSHLAMPSETSVYRLFDSLACDTHSDFSGILIALSIRLKLSSDVA